MFSSFRTVFSFTFICLESSKDLVDEEIIFFSSHKSHLSNISSFRFHFYCPHGVIE